jgi:hypothetical protein
VCIGSCRCRNLVAALDDVERSSPPWYADEKNARHCRAFFANHVSRSISRR